MDPRINLRLAPCCGNCYHFSSLAKSGVIRKIVPGYCRPDGIKKWPIATLKDKNLKITATNCVCDRHRFSLHSHVKTAEIVLDYEFSQDGSAQRIEEEYDWNLD